MGLIQAFVGLPRWRSRVNLITVLKITYGVVLVEVISFRISIPFAVL